MARLCEVGCAHRASPTGVFIPTHRARQHLEEAARALLLRMFGDGRAVCAGNLCGSIQCGVWHGVSAASSATHSLHLRTRDSNLTSRLHMCLATVPSSAPYTM